MTATLEESYIPELEQEVLGSLLLCGKVNLVSGHLRREQFNDLAHLMIFEKMNEAEAQFGSASAEVVHRMFSREEREAIQKKLTISLPEYLARLMSNCVYGAAGLKHSVPAMQHQWARLTLGREAAMITAAACDPGVDPVALARSAVSTIDEISSTLRSGRQRKTAFSIGEAAAVAIGNIEDAMRRGNGLTGVTWGLADLDRATGGMQRGEMTVIGARPSMGKTAVGMSVALKAAQAGAAVGFISLEMAARTLSMRGMTDLAFDRHGAIPYNDLISGRVSDADFEKVVLVAEEMKRLPLQIEDAPGLSVSEIRAKFERMNDAAERAGAPLDVLVVDYLQLVAASSRYQGNRTAEVSEISAGLRNMAREYGIALVALSQLSRGVESRPLKDRRPMLSDLRESGAIEQDADTVCFLFREAYYLSKEKGGNADEEADRLDRLAACEHKLEFIIAKQRNGPTKTIDLFFDPACSAVRNAAKGLGHG